MISDALLIENIEEITKALVQSDYFDPKLFGSYQMQGRDAVGFPRLSEIAESAERVRGALRSLADLLHNRVVMNLIGKEHAITDPTWYDRTGEMLRRILDAVNGFRRESAFAETYGELLSCYLLALYRSGAPGRESPIISMILDNIARRKAIESDRARINRLIDELQQRVTVALIAKRYAVYVLATQGLKILFRAEIEYRSVGKSPEKLALELINVLVKRGISLRQVTDVVCAGGDLGTLPDGIYVLNERVRAESLKRINNSSLNRGALIACELQGFLRAQGDGQRVHLSLAGPLSFATLASYELNAFLKPESRELRQELRGHVKVTPLKSMSSLISQILRVSQDELNLLVMSLDELFASVVRKTGPRITRELAAQDANTELAKFDFPRIVEALRSEKFEIPPNFRLASHEIGTGVKEICELVMIIESGRISDALSHRLRAVVNMYSRRVAQILEMAAAGPPSQRPHFMVIASMMALDPHFLKLFGKIRNRLDSPFTPVMCVDSLEHEYLIANHLFEMYLNPAQGDRRLSYSMEAEGIRHALQVVHSTGGQPQTFSFSSLMERVTGEISEGAAPAGNLVLVGADNDDALNAVVNAREFGLLHRVVLIGNPDDITEAVDHSRIALDLNDDKDVEILPIDPLAVDFESKKEAMAKVFGDFLRENPDFLVMKGSLSTAPLLHRALSIYKEPSDSVPGAKKRRASHTALFVLPDGRFFALSDAGVNPGFRNSEALLTIIENQVEIVRKLVAPEKTLKLAIITAVEKRTSAIPATHLAAETTERATDLKDRYGPLIIEGPLSFDLATVPEVSEEKHYEGFIKGDADCLVATDINTANVLYKMLSKTMGSLGLIVDTGSIITAGPGSVPIVLTSRGDTSQTKMNSILLALAYSHRSAAGPGHTNAQS